MNRIKNTKAFTLIELVVVIVILGILAAIAAFAYQNFISNARDNSTQRTIDQVSKSYYASRANGATVAAALDAARMDAVAAGYVLSTAGTPPNASGNFVSDSDTSIAISSSGNCYRWTPGANDMSVAPNDTTRVKGAANSYASITGGTCVTP